MFVTRFLMVTNLIPFAIIFSYFSESRLLEILDEVCESVSKEV